MSEPMNILDLTDQEITRAADLLKTEFEHAAKAGIVGPDNAGRIFVATWIVAALLRKIDEKDKGDDCSL